MSVFYAADHIDRTVYDMTCLPSQLLCFWTMSIVQNSKQ
jgi:hypothetical protein